MKTTYSHNHYTNSAWKQPDRNFIEDRSLNLFFIYMLAKKFLLETNVIMAK